MIRVDVHTICQGSPRRVEVDPSAEVRVLMEAAGLKAGLVIVLMDGRVVRPADTVDSCGVVDGTHVAAMPPKAAKWWADNMVGCLVDVGFWQRVYRDIGEPREVSSAAELVQEVIAHYQRIREDAIRREYANANAPMPDLATALAEPRKRTPAERQRMMDSYPFEQMQRDADLLMGRIPGEKAHYHKVLEERAKKMGGDSPGATVVVLDAPGPTHPAPSANEEQSDEVRGI